MASALVQQPFLAAIGAIFIPVVVIQHSVAALSHKGVRVPVGVGRLGLLLGTLVAFREHFRFELVTHGSTSALLDTESIHPSMNLSFCQGLVSSISSD